MLVVKAIDFKKKGRLAGDEVAFHDFRHMLEGGDHVRVLVVFRETDADERAHVEAYGPRFDDHAGTRDYPVALHFLDPLVNRGPRDVALAGYFQKRHSRIVDQVGEDPPVDFVDVIVSHIVYFLNRLVREDDVGEPSAMMRLQSSSVRAAASVPFGIL